MNWMGLLVVAAVPVALAGQKEDGMALNDRGLEAAAQRNFPEAERLHLQSVEIWRGLGAEYEPHLSIALFNLAEALCGEGMWGEGGHALEQSLELSRRSLGTQDLHTLSSMNALANTSLVLGDDARAESLFNEALAVERGRYPNSMQLANTLAGLSSVRLRAGKPDDALPLAEESLRVTIQAAGEGSGDAAMAYQNVAQIHRRAGRIDRALPLFRKAHAILERAIGPTHPRFAALLSQEGLALMDDGKLTLAEQNMTRAVSLLDSCAGCKFELAVAEHNLGLLRIRQKKYAEADAALNKALSLEELYSPGSSEDATSTRNALAQVRSLIQAYR